MKQVLLSVLAGALILLGSLTNFAFGAPGITAYVTMTDYPCFSSQNMTPGEIIIFHATIPNAGNDYDGIAGRLTITGNVTDAAIPLSYGSGYFTCVFYNGGYSQATNISTSPIDYNTSTSYLSSGATFNITISCFVPDVTPPSPQSAATNTSGNQVTITFDESVEWSYADVSDFTVKVGGSPVTLTGVSFSGTDAILTLQNAVTSGQTVTVSYTNTSDGLCDDIYNPTASFTDYAVTNNSTAGGSPTITSFSPTSACPGSVVTITGTNFTGATSVSFGGTAATSFSVVSATSITAVVDNGTSGSVSVTTAGGTGTKTGFTMNTSIPGTITYNSAIGAQTIVSDGQAGSTDYCGITLNVYGANSGLSGLPNAITYEPNIYPGASGLAANYASNGGSNYIIIKSSSNTVNFSLQSILLIDYGGNNIKIEGFDGGTPTGSINYTTNTDPYYFTLDQAGVLTPSIFQNIDEVRISAQDGDIIWIAVNNIQLSNPVVIPTVSSVSVPANATYNAGQNLDFTVNFSQAITATGTPNLPITLNTGGTVNASYLSGSGTSALIFRYTVVSGNQDNDGVTVGSAISLNGGTLKNAGGTNANLTLNSVGSTSNVKIDAVAPTVSSVSATTANGTYKLGDIISVTVTFSEAVTVTGTPTLSLNSGGTATYSSGSGTTTLAFSYTVGSGQSSPDLDYSTTNSLSLSGGTIKDEAGNNSTLTLPTVGGGSSLGGQKNIVITLLPTITTQGVTSIQATSSTGNGNITDLGSPNPTAYGVCWNTTGAPTTSDNKVDNGTASSTGAFTAAMTGLTASTTYYVRAFATNTAGTSYGTEVSFTTNSLNVPVFTSPSSAFDVSNAVYSNKNFNVSSQTSYPYGVAFSSDGSKMFVSGIFNSTVIKYNLSTANDVSTASYVQNFTPVSSGARPLDVALSPDGSKLFCLMQYGTVVEFTLSTPYDLSTASSNYTLTVVSTDYGMDFSSDGTKLYIADRDAKSIYQYNLGTAYNLSTVITPYSKSYSVNSQESLPMDVALSTDGTKMFVVGIGSGKVVEYSLGTAFDVSTAVHTGSATDLSLGAQEANPYGMAFSADGSKLYVIGFTSKVHQYNMKASVSFAENGTGNVTDVDANDGEGGATDTGITYSLTSVDDNDLFNINSTSGVITFKSAPDYENPGDSNHDNVYLVTVTANDGSTSNNISTLDITVTVTDVAENNPPTGASFSTSSGPHQNVVYTFSTSDFGYSDTDSDPLNHIRITAVPANGILYLDADNGDDYDSGEELANNALISKANLDAGNLQYYTTGSASTSFTFDVNDGTDYSASTYMATLNVISKPIVTTTAVTVFNTTSATMGGNVTADGGASVSERGVIYSSSDATPTIAEGATKDTNGTGTGAFSESIGSLSPATTYYIQAYAINSEGTSYGSIQSFTTQKLSQTITFNDLPDKTYGDADFAPDASASSTLIVTYSSSDADVATIVGNQIHIVGAGSCTIYADQPGNGLYSAAPQANKTLTVSKATLTATADNQTKVYGAANPTLTFQYSGWVNGVETIDTPPSIATTVTGTSAADTYTDAITLSGGTDNNYTLNLESGDFEVTKADLTVTADDQSKVYGATNPTLTFQYSGWVNGVETIDTPPSIATTVTGTSAADIYTDAITLSGGTDNNYTLNLVSGDFEVTKADLTVTADDQSKVYGAANPTLTFQYTGWVNGVETIDTPPTISTTVDGLSGVATYANSIILSGGSDNNYTLNLASGDFEVTKAELTVTADDQTKVYGETNPTLTFQYSGWVNGVETIDTPPSIATTVTGTSAADTYTDAITLSGGTDNNYTLNLVSGDFEVTKAELTVTADDQTKVYGATNPTLTFQYSGWVNGVETIDTPPSIATTVTGTSAADIYTDAITLSGGTDNNYTLNLVSGDFEVTKADLTVTADDQSKVYGAANPTLTFQYSGWVNGVETIDTPPAISTTVDGLSGVATYANSIILSGGSDNNYTLNLIPGDFEVTKAILTVTADNQTKVYGAANPTLTFHYTGWVNGVETIDTPPFISTSVNETSPAGTYIGAITVSGAVDDKYDFVYVPGNFEVTKSILTVTAHRQVKEYGAPNPPLTFSYSGWVNGIEEIDVPPTIFTNVDFITTAGTYVDAILFFGGSDDHYTFNFVYGTFEVYKATLLVSADKQTRKYGEENPELTYTVSGWKNSDQIDDLITKPVVSTTVAVSSGAGTYNDATTVSGAYDVNYVFNYTPADFEVTKATLTVSAESKSKCFDGEVYSSINSATYSGFAAGEDPTNLEGDLNFNGTFATAKTPGTYTIIPEGLTSQNYDIVYQNGTLVINPLPTATISGDAEICAGSTGMIKVGLTGQAPWSLTYTDGTTTETVTDIYENSYSIGVTIPENTSKTYTITSVTDFNGCSNTAQGSATIKSKSTISAGEISGDQLIAPGTLPIPITSVKPGSGSGSITYAWESSVDNGLNWEIIPEENGETYAPEVPDQTIWFRRLAISSESNVNCSALTDPVKISLWPTGLYNQEHSDNVWSAYAVRNTEIRLKANVGSSAIARLYDIQGRLILMKNLEEGSLNIIPTPNIKTGIYLLFIKENERIQGFKIPVRE